MRTRPHAHAQPGRSAHLALAPSVRRASARGGRHSTAQHSWLGCVGARLLRLHSCCPLRWAPAASLGASARCGLLAPTPCWPCSDCCPGCCPGRGTGASGACWPDTACAAAAWAAPGSALGARARAGLSTGGGLQAWAVPSPRSCPGWRRAAAGGSSPGALPCPGCACAPSASAAGGVSSRCGLLGPAACCAGSPCCPGCSGSGCPAARGSGAARRAAAAAISEGAATAGRLITCPGLLGPVVYRACPICCPGCSGAGRPAAARAAAACTATASAEGASASAGHSTFRLLGSAVSWAGSSCCRGCSGSAGPAARISWVAAVCPSDASAVGALAPAGLSTCPWLLGSAVWRAGSSCCPGCSGSAAPAVRISWAAAVSPSEASAVGALAPAGLSTCPWLLGSAVWRADSSCCTGCSGLASPAADTASPLYVCPSEASAAGALA